MYPSFYFILVGIMFTCDALWDIKVELRTSVSYPHSILSTIVTPPAVSMI